MQVNPPLRVRRLWLAVGVLLVAAICILSLMPESGEQDATRPEGTDKVEHVLAYGLLMFWFAHLEPEKRGRIRLAVGIMGMGVALECLQGLIGHREFSVADLAANAVGIAIGWIAARPRAGNLMLRLEARRTRATPSDQAP
jgi:VanZ family protein